MKAIIELLSRSGIEIEHASSRAGGKTHIEIGTPQDLEDVPLPKEVRDLKLSPEQEAMFKLLLDLDKKGDTTLAILRRFESYEKREDKKKGKAEPEKKKGAAPDPLTPPVTGQEPAPITTPVPAPASETVQDELPPGEPEGSPEDKQPGDAAPEDSETTTTPEA